MYDTGCEVNETKIEPILMQTNGNSFKKYSRGTYFEWKVTREARRAGRDTLKGVG
jgi:hypothetical protein